MCKSCGLGQCLQNFFQLEANRRINIIFKPDFSWADCVSFSLRHEARWIEEDGQEDELRRPAAVHEKPAVHEKLTVHEKPAAVQGLHSEGIVRRDFMHSCDVTFALHSFKHHFISNFILFFHTFFKIHQYYPFVIKLVIKFL